jgi:hypothetical protein
MSARARPGCCVLLCLLFCHQSIIFCLFKRMLPSHPTRTKSLPRNMSRLLSSELHWPTTKRRYACFTLRVSCVSVIDVKCFYLAISLIVTSCTWASMILHWQGVPISPWFGLIAEKFLYPWMDQVRA